MFMSKEAKSVTLLVRGPSLEASMSHYLIQQIENNPKIQVRTCTEVVDTCGEDGHLSGLWLEDRRTGVRERVDCGRMCCFIGAVPRTEWLDGVLALDDHGFVLAGPDLKDVCGWNRDTTAAPLGNKCARCVCCRGCARRVCEACRGGRRRRIDGRDAGAPLPGRGLEEREEAVMGEKCLPDELRTLFLFETLTDEQLATLCENGHVATYEPGPICIEGDPATCFYVLIDGELVMSKRSGGVDIETNRTSQRGVYCGAWSATIDARTSEPPSTRRRSG